MKHLIVLSAVLVSLSAFAGPQQEKMKNCNAEAKTKNLKGQERKDFMKTCLSGSAAAPAPVAATDVKPADSKERMKWCNEKAKGKSGAERKEFMSSCLKKDEAAPAQK